MLMSVCHVLVRPNVNIVNINAVNVEHLTLNKNNYINYYLIAQNYQILKKNNYSGWLVVEAEQDPPKANPCLLYTSPSPRDLSTSRMPSSA